MQPNTSTHHGPTSSQAPNHSPPTLEMLQPGCPTAHKAGAWHGTLSDSSLPCGLKALRPLGDGKNTERALSTNGQALGTNTQQGEQSPNSRADLFQFSTLSYSISLARSQRSGHILTASPHRTVSPISLPLFPPSKARTHPVNSASPPNPCRRGGGRLQEPHTSLHHSPSTQMGLVCGEADGTDARGEG